MPEDNKTQKDKVLFVDDDPLMRTMLGRFATLSGLEDVEVFEGAPQAVARLEGLEEAPTVVFSDGLHGEWRAVIAAAKAAKIPAVVLSADDHIKDEVEATGARFLSKSETISPELIKATVEELLKSQPTAD